MGLSSATITTKTALATVSAETAVISRNISGVNTSGFSLKTANVVTSQNGGATVVSVTNAQNQALFDSVLSATSSSAAQSAITNGLTTLQSSIGDTSSTTSPSAQLSDLTDALQSYEASPSDSSLAASVVDAASSLATTLNNATTTVQQLREQTDQQMASSVSSINSLLTQFQSVNSQIVSGTATGSDVSDLEDTRNSILTQLSQQIGISTTSTADGGMSIYTDSGVTLFQGGIASTVTFQATSTYTASTTGNAVYVNGVAITGSSATMTIQSGAQAGLADLRDNVTVTYQAQLDQTAQGLISAFAETDPSGSGSTLAGLFTNGGSTTVPSSSSDTGLAGAISVNAAVDPSQGGTDTLLRDGINFTFNTTSAASYSTQLNQLLTNLSTDQTFNSDGQIGTSNTVSGYATASAGWLDGQLQTSTSEATYQSTLLSNSTSALSNATGVNLDNEMSQMLDLENSYSATAKLLTTINSMFTSLLSAINPTAA
jgi:flagellar hook-associated protein 1